MPVLVSLLRGINVGGRNKIKMEPLRTLYDSLGFKNAQTYVQSGNVVFSTPLRNLEKLGAALENAIAQTFGVRCAVILRTPDELRDVVARNPFAGEPGIEGHRLLVTFFARAPDLQVRERIAGLPATTERLHLDGRELYSYFPDGIGFSKLVRYMMTLPVATGRNWNTVCKLIEISETMERR